jgi:hypothetical protein
VNSETVDNRLDPNAPYDPANPETLEYRPGTAIPTGENNSGDPNAPDPYAEMVQDPYAEDWGVDGF